MKLWQATNPNARDFRLETIGPAWTDSALPAEAGGVYTGKIKAPAQGWTACFIELTYPTAGAVPFKFTPSVRVLPDALPYKMEIIEGHPN